MSAKKKEYKKLIIEHPGPFGSCFDVWGPPEVAATMEYRMADCPYVLEEGIKGYIGSSDLAHTSEINAANQAQIDALRAEGYRYERRGTPEAWAKTRSIDSILAGAMLR